VTSGDVQHELQSQKIFFRTLHDISVLK